MARPGNGGRSFSADFKARVARDAMRETDALKAVAARHGVHPSQVKEWRSRFEEGGRAAFHGGAKREADQAAAIKDLHAKIGELTMERDFFKSFRALSRPERMAVIRKDNPMGIAKQASSADLALMRRMDELHTNPPPCYGAHQMVAAPRLEGMLTGRDRVRRHHLTSPCEGVSCT